MTPRSLLVGLAATVLLPLSSLAERAWSPPTSSGRPPRIALEAGPVMLTMNGRAQLQITAYTGGDSRLADGIPAEVEGFRLRRARLGLGAEYKGFSIGVEADLVESEGTALHEAFVGWENEWALVYGGIVKVPMSRAALISSEALQHGERSMAIRGIAPSHQLGVQVGGKVWDERVRLVAGVFNGMTRGKTFASGWTRLDPTEGNRFDGFAVSARLDFEPLGLLGEGVADLGQGTDPRLGIGGGFFLNRGGTYKSLGFSADIAFKWYGVGLAAEFIQMENGLKDQPTQNSAAIGDVTYRGLTTQLGYTIVKNWFEVALRFDMIDEAVEVEDEGDYISIGATASTYILDGHIKVQAYYDHRLERHGKSLANDVFLFQVEGRF